MASPGRSAAPGWPQTSGGHTELCDRLSATSLAMPPMTVDRPGDALGKLLDALQGLRTEGAPAKVIERAGPALCNAGVFDRVMFSVVRGAIWLPQSLYARDRSGGVIEELDDVVGSHAIALASPLPEAEVVRRRLPALVDGAQSRERGYRPLVEGARFTDYVVAPVVTAQAVIALLHADNNPSGRTLSSVERDLLRIFADSVGMIYECAELAERIEQQRAAVSNVCDAVTLSLASAESATPVGIADSAARSMAAAERVRVVDRPTSGRLARLTPREREVLELLSSGATNSQLADRLTVAESTIKSHIKKILRKLGTSNRAGAIAFYMKETRANERRMR